MLLSLRDVVAFLRDLNELSVVDLPLSPKFEIAAALKVLDGIPILFEKVVGYDTKIVGGVCGSKGLVSKILGVSSSALHDTLLNAISNPTSPTVTDNAPIKERIEKPNLHALPILTHYEHDAGPYITCGIVFARDLEGGFQNASFHRMLALDEKTLVIRIVPRHLYYLLKRAEKRKHPLPVAIAIGLHPAVLLAAASSPPLGVDELHVANTLMRNELKVTPCNRSEILVPAESEIVLEGFIYPDKLAEEGPFVDITGTYDFKRNQPIIEIVEVMMRRNPIYQALLPASIEHRFLMGFHREALIRRYVSQVVSKVKGVKLSFGGCGWLHAIVSIEKSSEGDGKNAILAAFAAHPSLKHVVVVDSDIDINDPSSIEWAIATRFQAHKDLVVIRNVRGSSIDPSINEKRLLTSKMGLDATKPLEKPKSLFMKALIPNLSEVKKKLEDLNLVSRQKTGADA